MVLSGFLFQRGFSRIAFAVLSLLFVVSARAQGGEIAGTMPEDYIPQLKEILANALLRSPQIIAKEFDRQATEARLTMANSSRLPSVGGNFNYASTQTATSADTSAQTRDNGFFYSFSASQALFHWGALANERKAARINLLISEKRIALAYRELSVLLRQSYLSLLVEKARVRQARGGVKELRQDLVITAEKKERGLVAPAVLEGERLREQEAMLELKRTEAAFAASRLRFARLAGLRELNEEALPDEIPLPTYSPELAAAMTAELLKNGAKSTLEYEIYDLRLRDALLRYKIEKTRLLPKFGANASYSLENNTNVNGAFVEQKAITRQTIGIGGEWRIFDGFATQGAVRVALIARRSLETSLATEMDELQQNAQVLERSLKLDAEQIELTDIRRGLAEETKRRIAEEVKFGNVPRGDVEHASMGIYFAEANVFASRATFLSHWAEFVAITGKDPVLNNLPVRYGREKK